MNYKIIWVIVGVVSILLLTILGLYIGNFYNRNLSDNPEEWGQFGDYIGGTINTTISILNLFLLTYLTIKIAKLEEGRINNTSKNSVKPLGLFSFDVSNEFFKIELHNVGLGPLILKEFKIYDQDKEYEDFKELLDNIPLQYYRPKYSITKSTSNGTIVRKDDFLNIIDMQIDKDTPGAEYSKKIDSLKIVKTKLASCEIKITYADLFGNIISEEIEKLEPVNVECN
ncbi:putative membrane protein [Chryseobacterium vietnamense]|uniref:Membrane protein n=1 Tax=Chryseobacterium vietnamense TaxID=866785 RepID=A0ACC6J8B1_9FLAO|nr:hypothetical protein [Chryseobacterium vietnamense]MDR6459060.1 putative membrane protein [Chryseobacterium vietnamense]